MSHYAPITKNFFFATDTGLGYANERIKDPINGSFIHHGIALELGAHFAYDIGYMICRIGMQYELTTVFGEDRGSGEKGKGFISSFAPQLSFTLPLWTR